ncbi:Sucrose transport protein SUT4 [Galdieria sulphuraria]|nr:Sucrose transport protein SUT4 [Galdieria sulphuraria]
MLVSLLGIHFSIFNALPFALVASVLDGANTGLYMGVLNASCVVAQVVGNFTAGWASDIVGKGDISFGMAVGALFSIVGVLLIPLLTEPSSPQYRTTAQA